MNKTVRLTVVSVLALLLLFVVSAYFVQVNLDFFERFVGDSVFGMIVYVLIVVVAAVAAPVNVLPLVPIASSQWGWVITGFLTLLGETLGALIAFAIAREYGYPVVRKFVSLEKLHNFEKLIPERHVFAGIVFLRIAVPFDVINYALGLLSRVGWKRFTLATVIGYAPYAFVTSYLGGLPFVYLVNSLLVGGIIFLLIIILGLTSEKETRKRFLKWWEGKFR